MSNSPFPMQFAEIELHIMYKCFAFMLPRQEMDRDDIEIFVEVSLPKEGKATYRAWARFLSLDIRAVVCRDVIQVKDENNICEEVICHLNMSEYFYGNIGRFVEHFGPTIDSLHHCDTQDCDCSNQYNCEED